MVKEMSDSEKTLNPESIKSVENQVIPQVFEGRKKIGPSWLRLPFFNKKYTSLYIDDTGLKLLTVKGNQVTKWADLPLEPGLVKDGVIEAPGVVSKKIKELLREHKVSRRKVIVGFSGIHCLSRVITLPKLSGAVLNEAIKREIEGELPIPLENLHLAWQIVGTSKKELKIFVITFARDIADSLILTLKQTGIKPYLMDLSPLAITRTSTQKTAAIVDTRSTGIDIVILVDGLPELIRSLPLPEEKSLAEKISITKDELLRTIKYYFSNKPETSSQAGIPVFLSGIILDEPDLYQSSFQNFEYNVVPAQIPLKYPSQMTNNHFLVNIGLILKQMSLKGSMAASRVNLNALPQSYAGKQISWAPPILAFSAVVIAGLIIYGINNLKAAATYTESLRAELVNQNKILVQQLSTQKTLSDALPGLQEQVSSSSKTLQNLMAIKTSFADQHSAINEDLTLITSNLGAKMTLDSVTHAGNLLTLKGTAPGQVQVRDYANKLEISGRYSGISISSIEKNEYSNVVKIADRYQFQKEVVYNYSISVTVKN
jgi:hypothetical protein